MPATPSHYDSLLDARSVLDERPFTHPERTVDDLRALNLALSRLRAALLSGLLQGDGPMQQWHFDDEQGLHQRVIVRSGHNLRTLPQMFLVGFFGQRRESADVAHMSGVDDQMVEEMGRHHEKIVAYYTAQLPNGQFGNLVLSVADGARDEWNQGPRHAHAVRELAPAYYRSIRLHNGLLEGSLLCHKGPMLTVTKYYDFGESGAPGVRPWRALRTWDPPVRLPD